jgi:hypothetical protein
MPQIGFHGSTNDLDPTTIKDILEEAREKVEYILSTHKPLPMGDDVEKELESICKRAQNQ